MMATKRILTLGFSCFLGGWACTGPTVLADDTEIYSGNEQINTVVYPNILLELDTSGSMGDQVSVSYDPATVYGFDTDSFGNVIDKNGNILTPAQQCSNDELYYKWSTSNDGEPEGFCGDRKMPLPLFKCWTSIDILNTVGYDQDSFVELDPGSASPSWDVLVNNSSEARDSTHIRECKGDRGDHGDGDVTLDPATNLLSITGPFPTPIIGASGNDDVPLLSPTPGTFWSTSFGSGIDSGDYTDVVVYHPNYMRYKLGWTDKNGDGVVQATEHNDYTPTKIEVLKEVMTDLLSTWNNLNVGIMRYAGQDGGAILHPLVAINEPANRQSLIDTVNALDTGDATPISEVGWEGFAYFTGRKESFGDLHSTKQSVPESKRVDDPDTAEDESRLYQSPIEFTCQANFVIHMTDGRPTRDGGMNDADLSLDPIILDDGITTTTDVDEAIKGLVGFYSSGLSDTQCNFTTQSGTHDNIEGDPDWDNCMDELAEYAANVPQTVVNKNGDTLVGKPIETYTIGFDINDPFLQLVADKGSGSYFTANTAAALRTAFDTAISQILANNGPTVISAPGVAVEAYSRTLHLDQLYFGIFEPLETPHWNGNLKRFKLGIASGDNFVSVLDANDNKAIEAASGFFLDTSHSFWSDSVDGNSVTIGGAAGELTNTRKVYTYVDGTDVGQNLAGDGTTGHRRRFHEDNANIPFGLDGNGNGLNLTAASPADPAADAAARAALMQWARGIDVDDFDNDSDTTDARQIMGDPLHSRPVLVVYDPDVDPDPNVTTPDIVVFSSNNDGYLHATDADNGTELWSFIPPQLWRNLDVLRNDGITSKGYGLDGQITIWVDDDDDSSGVIQVDGEDGIPGTADDDHVFLFFGMRRGGSNYYALDVTDRNNPVLLWHIQGGVDTGFEELASTWAKPQNAKVQIGATEKRVLFFTGGYDTNDVAALGKSLDEILIDDISAISTDGNALYMIDAETGTLLWKASDPTSTAALKLTDMNYAIPADPLVLDLNNDHLADRVYVVDYAGGLFRFDIHNGNTDITNLTAGDVSDDLITGAQIGIFSNRAGSGNRKFFNKPDAAFLNHGGKKYLTVNFGSGNRAHPETHKTIQNMFISFRDPNVVEGTTTSYQAIKTLSDLLDVSGDSPDLATLFDVTNHGWYLKMLANATLDGSGNVTAMGGEKVLASAVTAGNTVSFTTYTPKDTVTDCSITLGDARLYSISLVNSLPVLNFVDRVSVEDPGSLDPDNRSRTINYAGIPPEVIILFPEATGGQPIGLVGPQTTPVGFENSLIRTYWYRKED